MRGCPEPCLCGATDCRSCYPENFDRHGRYEFQECKKCGEEFEPEEDERICEECAKITECSECGEEFKPEIGEDLCEACMDKKDAEKESTHV